MRPYQVIVLWFIAYLGGGLAAKLSGWKSLLAVGISVFVFSLVCQAFSDIEKKKEKKNG